MRKKVSKYYEELLKTISSVRTTDGGGKPMDFHESIVDICGVIREQADKGGKLIFIGNGGSASIASHMALDFWKNGGIRAIDFSGNCLLTCVGNDFGYEYVFEKPIQMFADKGDVLFAISSSGKSENILRGVRAAREKGCKVVTLSGFSGDNPLCKMGDANYYVPSLRYGPVEVIHQIICHSILDTLMDTTNG